jgi:uroporphyrin-3 C-methyltransferase/uroporphyrinogen III methyltransferase/synthase
MSDSIQHLQRQLGKTRGDWLIADAEYLLSVANERLHLVGDVNTSREALEAADQRLRESGDAAVFKVREEVAKEIAALKNVPVPDIVGLFGSVQALQERVDQLALILPYSGKTPVPSAGEKQEKPGAEGKTDKSSDLVDSALNELEDIVTIRRTDQPIEEILTPQQVRFIREQLRVKLEMVKIALVQQNEAIFRASVQDAKAWTERNFNQSGENQKFINELNRLSETKIRGHFPDISASLKMLRDITKLRIESDKAMAPLPEVPSVSDAPTPAESAPAAPAASGAEPAPAAAVPSEKQ